MFYVYGLFNPITNQLFYVGKGTKANNRHKDHLTERRGKENRLRWKQICDIRKQNLEPVIQILIDNIENETIAYNEETRLIKKHGKIIDGTGILTNILDDARPPSWKGRVKTDEHRKNLSKSHLGKTLSAETKKKIIETKIKNGTLKSGMVGKIHTDSTKEKIRQSKLNVPMSTDSSLKKSVSLKDKQWTDARKKAAETQKKTGPKKGKPWSEARLIAQQNRKNNTNE
jgi:hypothetical protein